MRIDAHIHYTPPAEPGAAAELAAHEPYWAMLLAPGSHGDRGRASAERMLADMDRAGLDQVVLVGEYYQHHSACVARNTQAIALAQRFPERIIPFAIAQPLAGPQAHEELRRCVNAGMRGVGELNPYAQGFRLDDPPFLAFVEECLRHKLPITLHVNEPVGRAYPGKTPTPLWDYHALALRYPELTLILAHWGGGLLFYELIPGVRRALRNVYYDTAASPLLYPTADIFRTALTCVGAHKILYGSDYPLLLAPRTQTEPDFQPFLDEIAALGLAPDEQDAILGGNIARILGQTTTAAPQADLMPSRAQPPLHSHRSIDANTPIQALAAAWPATRPILERHGLAWQDTPVPPWESLEQAAAARGHGLAALTALIAELRDAAQPS